MDKVSMISVWFLDDLDAEQHKLFIGHVGVLIPDGDKYLFVEKLSFSDPYQMLSFQTKEDLNNYLMRTYEIDSQQTVKPIIMENDKLFTSYATIYK